MSVFTGGFFRGEGQGGGGGGGGWGISERENYDKIQLKNCLIRQSIMSRYLHMLTS